MFEDKLQMIGFTEREAKLYIELLRIGPQAVSVAAKRLGLNRTTAYSVLKSLEEKGVVASYKNGSVKYFSANDPNCLVGYLDRKCRTYGYYRSEILLDVPKFRSLCGEFEYKKPVVSFFEGIEGMKYVMYDTLNAENEFCSFLPLHKLLDIGMKDFVLEYGAFRIKNRKVKLRAIVPESDRTRQFFRENHEYPTGLTEILYVSEDFMGKMFENQINIYNDKVAILHLDKGNEYGVVIESEEISMMHRGIFEMAWRGCSKVNEREGF